MPAIGPPRPSAAVRRRKGTGGGAGGEGNGGVEAEERVRAEERAEEWAGSGPHFNLFDFLCYFLCYFLLCQSGDEG